MAFVVLAVVLAVEVAVELDHYHVFYRLFCSVDFLVWNENYRKMFVLHHDQRN